MRQSAIGGSLEDGNGQEGAVWLLGTPSLLMSTRWTLTAGAQYFSSRQRLGASADTKPREGGRKRLSTGGSAPNVLL